LNTHRTKRGYLGIAARGALMGAADAVPGVSGGTIAFMTGIYEELLFSLKQCGPAALTILFTQGFAPAWKYINGGFLSTLFAGVIISLLTVSRGVLYLLAYHPILLWSFFFGLIIAAVWSVTKQIENWNLTAILAFSFGTISAFLITSITPTSVELSTLVIFMAGMIAICAMILPGISGSFILLLLGVYQPMLQAIKSLQFSTLAIFASGCILGLLSFSRVLNWMFQQYRIMTLSILSGFMLGSLNKVWPWKQTLEYTTTQGEIVPLSQTNVLPSTFETLTQQPADLLLAITLMIIGILLVVALEYLSQDAQP
jgi:putative membrane protein